MTYKQISDQIENALIQKQEIKLSYSYFDGMLDINGNVMEIGQYPFYVVSQPVLSSLKTVFDDYTLTPLSEDVGVYENSKFRAKVALNGNEGLLEYHIIPKKQVVI
ncbi:MAG: hypothetical protein ACTSX6_06885 [Candidatus Heimdallarchaeaceae archaeon]